jgi:ParB/RepB/Spo0J family partition protein
MSKILLASIIAPTFNSRVLKTGALAKKEEAELANLAASMKAQGQLQPIEVETTDVEGQHLLVFGDRRRRAALSLGWTDIEATVRPMSTANERALRNGIENVKRENLTSYEVARMCASYRDMGLKDAEIAGQIGIASTTVSNLGVTYRRMPAPILKEWEQQNPLATDRFLRELATEKNYPTPEKIMQAWDVHVAEAASAEAETGKKAGKRGKAKKGDGGTAGYPVSQKRVGHLIAMLGSKKNTPELSEDTRNWARALISYAVQGRETPPAGIPPIPPKEKTEKKDDKK